MNHLFPGGHGHRGMVVGTAEVDLVAVLQADQRIVGGHLRIVAVSVRLRHTVQLASPEAIGVSAAQSFGNVGNVRTPMAVRRSGWSKDLKVGSAVGVEHLTRGQKQEATIESEGVRRVRWRNDGIEGRTVKFEKAPLVTTTTNNAEYMPVWEQGRRSIEGAHQVSAGIGRKIEIFGGGSIRTDRGDAEDLWTRFEE